MVGEVGFVNIALKLSHFNRKQMPSVFIIISVQSYWNGAQIYSVQQNASIGTQWREGGGWAKKNVNFE